MEILKLTHKWTPKRHSNQWRRPHKFPKTFLSLIGCRSSLIHQCQGRPNLPPQTADLDPISRFFTIHNSPDRPTDRQRDRQIVQATKPVTNREHNICYLQRRCHRCAVTVSVTSSSRRYFVRRRHLMTAAYRWCCHLANACEAASATASLLFRLAD